MYRAVKAGADFASACKEGASGSIHSIFDKTMNIELKGRDEDFALFTIARSDADETMATLVVSMPISESWSGLDDKFNARIGTPVFLAASAVYFDGIVLADDISRADVWRPVEASVLRKLPRLTDEEIGLRCDEAARYIKIMGENNSVYPLITRFSEIFLQGFTYGEDAFIRQFLHGVLTLHHAISCHDIPTEVDFDTAVNMLLGFGYGLTPSGDDFLAGVLYGMYFTQGIYAQRCDVLPVLANAVRKNMTERTNRISRHFLRYASEGQWGSATQEFMLALFRPDAQQKKGLYQAIDKKLAHGATSGMDEMFGIMVGVCCGNRL